MTWWQSLNSLRLFPTRSWMDHRRNRRQEQNRRLHDLKRNSANGQSLPEGTKIITIPIVEMAPSDNGQQVCFPPTVALFCCRQGTAVIWKKMPVRHCYVLKYWVFPASFGNIFFLLGTAIVMNERKNERW